MITLYLYENTIQYKDKKQIKEIEFPKEAMQYGKIKNIPIFELSLHKLIVKERWVTLFKSKKVNIIIPAHYTEMDKEVLMTILNNLGITHIQYQKETNLYNFKKNQIYLNIHRRYLIMLKKEYKKTNSFIYPFYIFNTLENTLKYILNKEKTSKIYLLGSNDNIPNIVNKLKQERIFYYHDYKNHLISKIP